MADESPEDLAKIAEAAPPCIETTVAPVILHRLSDRHRQAVMLSHTCGCFYCYTLFNPQRVEEWTDDGCTALCPSCGIDAVLPGYWVKLTPLLLQQMHAFYFETLEAPDANEGNTGDLG